MATPCDQSAGSASEAAKATKLRYPLRSASRGKVASPAVDTLPSASAATRRAKPSSDVTKSMCVLDLSSVKGKSAKPPRRHSIPTKPGASPRPTPTGTITPVSGVRSRRSDNLKFETPTSEVSMSSARRKFSTLSSISYWMTQIRLAEAASKHSISLGFFKLALESDCEPLDRMRKELKAYVARHGLATELEEPVKDVLQIYEIVDDFEKLKISVDASQEQKKSDKAVRTSTNVLSKGNLKPKSLNSDATENKEAGKKENIQKEKPNSKVRGSYNRNPAKVAPAKDLADKKTCKKTKKQAKVQQEDCNGGSEALQVGQDQESVDAVMEITHEDKENILRFSVDAVKVISNEDKENMGDTEMAIDSGVPQEV